MAEGEDRAFRVSERFRGGLGPVEDGVGCILGHDRGASIFDASFFDEKKGGQKTKPEVYCEYNGITL